MATRRKVHQQYGDRHLELAGRFASAYVDLKLRDLPPDVEVAVERAADYIARLGEQRTSELIERWKEVHADLMAAGNELKVLSLAVHPTWLRTLFPQATKNSLGPRFSRAPE